MVKNSHMGQSTPQSTTRSMKNGLQVILPWVAQDYWRFHPSSVVPKPAVWHDRLKYCCPGTHVACPHVHVSLLLEGLRHRRYYRKARRSLWCGLSSSAACWVGVPGSYRFHKACRRMPAPSSCQHPEANRSLSRSGLSALQLPT